MTESRCPSLQGLALFLNTAYNHRDDRPVNGADIEVLAKFWSFTVYDNETRCFVDTGVQPDRSSRNDIVTNSDGSVDLYFAPKAPAGKPAANWIETIPAKGWFAYFRLYGPTQPFFDRTV